MLLNCSPKSDFDSIVAENWRKCGGKTDCIIDFSTAMRFEWDTMYYYSIENSLDSIQPDLKFDYNKWEDIGDRVFFVKDNRIVYHQDWFPSVDKPIKGAIFLIEAKKIKLTKSNSKFKIIKSGEIFYLKKL